jgi:hypothetical protein
MERALVDDIRFRMLYEDPVVVNTTDPAMQYFALRRGARPPTDADIADHVRQAYAPFHPESAGPLAGAGHSLDALCALDSVNGTLITGPMQVPRTILTLIGWAYDRAEAGAPADVFAVMSSGERSYSLRASRVARPDVADAFEEPRFEMSGFTATGGIVDLPPGEYRVRLVQRRGEGFVSCDVPHRLAVTGAVR